MTAHDTRRAEILGVLTRFTKVYPHAGQNEQRNLAVADELAERTRTVSQGDIDAIIAWRSAMLSKAGRKVYTDHDRRMAALVVKILKG